MRESGNGITGAPKIGEDWQCMYFLSAKLGEGFGSAIQNDLSEMNFMEFIPCCQLCGAKICPIGRYSPRISEINSSVDGIFTASPSLKMLSANARLSLCRPTMCSSTVPCVTRR